MGISERTSGKLTQLEGMKCGDIRKDKWETDAARGYEVWGYQKGQVETDAARGYEVWGYQKGQVGN